MAESIINPSKIIDDKYRNTLFTITDGSTILGTIELEDARKVVIRTGPLSDQVIEVPKPRIQKRELSNISPMPNGLLNVLSREQILDLLAYLESGGKSDHSAFRK
jgi:putative heme-binding domain-containing protein